MLHKIIYKIIIFNLYVHVFVSFIYKLYVNGYVNENKFYYIYIYNLSLKSKFHQNTQ